MVSSVGPTNELLFRLIKITDMSYVTVLFFIYAYIVGYYLNEFFTYIYGTEFDKKTTVILFCEVMSQVVCIGILSYIGRNVVQSIPFPLDGVNGYEHSRIKELVNGAFIPVFIIMFQYSMQDKLAFIKNRFQQRGNKTQK